MAEAIIRLKSEGFLHEAGTLNLGGVKADVALWGRNLFDTQRMSYGLNLSELFFAANYIPARSYGMDLTISF